MNQNLERGRSLWVGDGLSCSRHGKRLNGPRGIELEWVITGLGTDRLHFGCLVRPSSIRLSSAARTPGNSGKKSHPMTINRFEVWVWLR